MEGFGIVVVTIRELRSRFWYYSTSVLETSHWNLCRCRDHQSDRFYYITSRSILARRRTQSRIWIWILVKGEYRAWIIWQDIDLESVEGTQRSSLTNIYPIPHRQIITVSPISRLFNRSVNSLSPISNSVQISSKQCDPSRNSISFVLRNWSVVGLTSTASCFFFLLCEWWWCCGRVVSVKCLSLDILLGAGLPLVSWLFIRRRLSMVPLDVRIAYRWIR